MSGSHNLFLNMLKTIMSSSFPDLALANEEIDGLSRLCAMSVSPAGENPKDFIRPLSDAVVGAIAMSSKSTANPLIDRISQIIFIEWCFRQGRLHEDWKWEWKGPTEGQLHYRMLD